jgi:aryl-phospho-beta-D-glucosidase BglC (GH1 family)
MKNLLSFTLLFLLLPVCLSCLSAQQPEKTTYRDWWNETYMDFPKPNPQAKSLARILVKGNTFINEKGEKILFRGVAISDPDKIEKQGHWNKQHFEQVKELGAAIVRIPVHPVAWRERTPVKYFELLDQAVAWCTELGMYVMIDWHTIGNLKMELFQDPMYNTSQKETYEFWRSIAKHFNGNNTVAFYEIFNEPTTFSGQLGSCSWTDWKKINEDIISLIRAYDKETIPLVAGFDWAYDLTSLHEDPIDAEGIGYVVHPYAWKRSQPYEPKWEENFGFAANQYPVFATEFGFDLKPGEIVNDDHYGNRIIRYLEGKGISWTCWDFDPEWGPRVLESWNPYKLTESGEFFKKAMHGEVVK